MNPYRQEKRQETDSNMALLLSSLPDIYLRTKKKPHDSMDGGGRAKQEPEPSVLHMSISDAAIGQKAGGLDDDKKRADRARQNRNARITCCRCFLPDLTGFTSIHRAEPDPISNC